MLLVVLISETFEHLVLKYKAYNSGMRIRRRGLTRVQVVVAAVVGIIGGTYIWKPFFENRFGTTNKDTGKDKDGNLTPAPAILNPKSTVSDSSIKNTKGAEDKELLTFEFDAERATE